MIQFGVGIFFFFCAVWAAYTGTTFTHLMGENFAWAVIGLCLVGSSFAARDTSQGEKNG